MRAVHEVAVAAFELVERLLVGGLRLVDVAADFLQGIDEADEFVVQPAAFVGDGQRVAVLLFGPPDVGDGAQGGQQGAGAGEHDAFVEAFLEQAGLLLEGGEVGGFDGDEHEDEIQRFQAVDVAVFFFGQFFDVLAHGLDVGGECLTGFLFVFRPCVADVGGEGDFAVDDDLFVVGQVD